jgi:hypothetical protein
MITPTLAYFFFFFWSEDLINKQKEKVKSLLDLQKLHALEIKRAQDEITAIESQNLYGIYISELKEYRNEGPTYFGRTYIEKELMSLPGMPKDTTRVMFKIGPVSAYTGVEDPRLLADAQEMLRERLEFYRNKALKEIQGLKK